MFSIVYITFIKRAMCFELFSSLLESERGVLNCFVNFRERARYFELFISIL